MSAFDFLKIKKTVSGLHAHVSKIREELASLRDERERIAKAPATREDVKNFLWAHVDKKAEDYTSVFDFTVINLASRPERMNSLPSTAIMTATRPNQAATAFTIESAACALFGDLLKKGIANAVEAAPWPADAMSLAERQRRLDALDTSIAALASEEGELLRHAHQSGLTIY